MQRILLAIMLLSSCTVGSKTPEFSRDKGLVVPLGDSTCVIQNGKQVLLKGIYLKGDIGYERNYVVQDSYLIMQTSHDLLVVRFDDSGNILAKKEIDNENYGNHGVALYGKTAITTGSIRDTTKRYSWNYVLKYVNVETGETSCVDLLKTTPYTGRNDVAKILALSLVGSKLYVLVNVNTLSSNSTAGMLYLSEYNLAADKTTPARMMPIDLATVASTKDSVIAQNLPTSPITSDSIKVSSRALFRHTPNSPEPEATHWSPMRMEASDKYVVVVINASTRFFVGESIGYMASAYATYLFIDRETLEPMDLYLLSCGADVYSDMYFTGSKLYVSSSNRLNPYLYLFDLSSPAREQLNKVTRYPYSGQGGINAYPIMLKDLLRKDFTDVAVAEMKGISTYAHFSLANDTVYYIDSYRMNMELGRAKIEKTDVRK